MEEVCKPKRRARENRFSERSGGARKRWCSVGLRRGSHKTGWRVQQQVPDAPKRRESPVLDQKMARCQRWQILTFHLFHQSLLDHVKPPLILRLMSVCPQTTSVLDLDHYDRKFYIDLLYCPLTLPQHLENSTVTHPCLDTLLYTTILLLLQAPASHIALLSEYLLLSFSISQELTLLNKFSFLLVFVKRGNTKECWPHYCISSLALECCNLFSFLSQAG